MSEKRFSWRTLALASLAFNVLIVGAAIGAKAAGVRFERESAVAAIERVPPARVLMRELSPESRVKFRRALVRAWLGSGPLRRASREARAELVTIASTPDYDAEAVRAGFARMRAADQETLAAFHEAVAAALGELDREERQRVLARIAETQRARGPARRLLEEEFEDEAP